ncbi:hypothetical protein [Nocardia yamanashiensis]|uniref:hypothetical protein n=1 Tax=Nocardia yamanashiensis TaxID=209247 RepID=UPI000B19B9DF|nr:hypothetical protein [Nocardia yamanashiensis]
MRTARRLKTLMSYLLTAVVGCGLLVGGAVLLIESGDGKVTCAGSEMKVGDTCTTSRRGHSTTRSYEEQKERDSWTPWVLLGIGTLALGGGGFLLVRELGRGATRGSARHRFQPAPPSHAPWPNLPQSSPTGFVPNYAAPQWDQGMTEQTIPIPPYRGTPSHYGQPLYLPGQRYVPPNRSPHQPF